MKFRAVMNDQQSMKDFLDIILTISKLTKRCVTNLTSRTIDVIVNEDSENGAPAVWAEFSSSDNFSEYAIEGPNKDTQQIMLSLNPANLANAIGALRSGATYFKLKLTNVQYPCLTIEIETATNNSRKILHDIPVNVILKSDWNNFLLPKLPKTNVFLTLPSNRSIKNFIEKLKNITPMIKFYATSGGEMNVFAETELSTVTMKYKNLELRSSRNQVPSSSENESSDDSSRASCVVECKKLALLFSSLQISTMEWSCGILHDVLIHIEIDMRLGVSIHSVIPAVCV